MRPLIMFSIRSTKSYRKAYKRISQNVDFDATLLEKVINTLARGEKLHEKYRDHQLSGEMRNCRECHIKNDLLLVYQKYENELILLLVDLGSHSSLFG